MIDVLVRSPYLCAKVWCVEFPEKYLQCSQLFAVTVRDRCLDLDGWAEDIADRTAESAGEEVTDTVRGQELEC